MLDIQVDSSQRFGTLRCLSILAKMRSNLQSCIMQLFHWLQYRTLGKSLGSQQEEILLLLGTEW